MVNRIEITSYISSTNYYFETKDSRCYINNEKTHNDLMLEGVFADLWYIILTTRDYTQIKNYAKSRQIENILDDFLEELKITGLIVDYDKPYDSTVKTQQSDKDYDKMLSDKVNWLVKNNFLNQLSIELSYNCNLTCQHCYNDKSNTAQKLNFSDVKNIIDSAIPLGVSSIYLSSGECTLHPDFIKILKYSREKRKSFSFATNGQRLFDDENLFEDVVNLYPHEIRVSLYSMNPEIHDLITGVKGSQKKTVAVIKKLRERNVPVHINYFQTKLNKNSLPDILKFKDEVGIGSLSADIFFLNNKENNNFHIQLSDEQIFELFQDKNSPYYNLLEYKNPCYGNEEGSACKNIKGQICVSPALDVYPCIALKYKIGNLKDTTLEHIWNNEYEEFLKVYKVKHLQECRSCEYFEYCIYCPCMAMYENGFLKKSDICCRFTKIRMEILKKKGKIK